MQRWARPSRPISARASIVFGVIVFDEHLPGGVTLAATVVRTIVPSIVIHGLSAIPLVAALKRRARQ